MARCLNAFDKASITREKWYGKVLAPAKAGEGESSTREPGLKESFPTGEKKGVCQFYCESPNAPMLQATNPATRAKMFSVAQEREIADKVEQILRETNHPELPKHEIQFLLHVV